MNNYQLLSCVPITSNNNKNVLKNTETFINQHGSLYIPPSLAFLSQENTSNCYYSKPSPPSNSWNAGKLNINESYTFTNISVSNQMMIALNKSGDIYYISNYTSPLPPVIIHDNSGIPRSKLNDARISFDGYTGDAVILDNEGSVWYANIDSGLYKSTCQWTKFPPAMLQGSPYYFSSISLSNKKIYGTQRGNPGSNIWYRADLSPNTEWFIAHASSNWYCVSYDGYSNPPLLLAGEHIDEAVLAGQKLFGQASWDEEWIRLYVASDTIQPTSTYSYQKAIPKWLRVTTKRRLYWGIISNGEIYAHGEGGDLWYKRNYDADPFDGWLSIPASLDTVKISKFSYDGGSGYRPGTIPTTPPPTTPPPTTPPPTTPPPTEAPTEAPTYAPSVVPGLSNVLPVSTPLAISTPVATQWIKGINNTYVMIVVILVLLIILVIFLKK